MLRRTRFIVPTFNKNTPNKIGNLINVSGKNTLVKSADEWHWRFAIADEPIDAKVDGKKLFCVRVDNSRWNSYMMFGFTPLDTFDSTKEAYFGWNGFTGCGIYLFHGDLRYPVNKWHKIIDKELAQKAKEIIVILTISNNGTKKEIRFLCDGNVSQSSDVSEHLQGDRLFPAISLYYPNQQITTIPIDQIKTRTPEIDELIKEYQEQQNEALTPVRPVSVVPSIASEPNSADQIISQLRQRIDEERQKQIGSLEEQLKQTRSDFLKQNEELRKDFLKQNEEVRKDFAKQLDAKAKESEDMRKDFLKQNEEMRKDFLKQHEEVRKDFQHERDTLREQVEFLRNLVLQRQQR
jgi:hypothetical protein